MFSLPLIYKIFTPLTVYSTIFLLKLFYNISAFNLNTLSPILIINSKTIIQLIPACIAGSAYLLLLILNLTVPMSLRKRLHTILLSFILLLALNILRIFILTVLYHNNFRFFDFTHKMFWYVLSTVFVVLIWFFVVKLYKIKEIPVYTDFKHLLKNVK